MNKNLQQKHISFILFLVRLSKPLFYYSTLIALIRVPYCVCVCTNDMRYEKFARGKIFNYKLQFLAIKFIEGTWECVDTECDKWWNNCTDDDIPLCYERTQDLIMFFERVRLVFCKIKDDLSHICSFFPVRLLIWRTQFFYLWSICYTVIHKKCFCDWYF